MKQTTRKAAALALCLALLLSGCSGQASSEGADDMPPAQSGTDNTDSAQEDAPYDGPLYAVSLRDIRESLPDLGAFAIDSSGAFTEMCKARYMCMSGQIESVEDYKSDEFRLLYDPDDAEARDACEAEIIRLETEPAADDADWFRRYVEAGELNTVFGFTFYSGITPESAAEYTSDIFFYAYSNSGDYVPYRKQRDLDNADSDEWNKLYLTNSRLEQFPELDQYQVLGTVNGLTIFFQSEQDGHFFLTDGRGNTRYTSPENIVLSNDSALFAYYSNSFGAEGMLAIYDTDTGRDCFLDLDSLTIVELEEGYSLNEYTRNGESVLGAHNGLLFSEGMKSVIYAESTDTLYHLMDARIDFDVYAAEADVAGYIDKSGAFVFRFCDLPQFEDQIIVSATGYRNGTAIVRSRPRAQYAGGNVPYQQLYAGTTYYEIDTEGNILRECTEEDRSEHEKAPLGPRGEELDSYVRRMGWTTDMEFMPVNRLLLADDLVLYQNKDGRRFELMDANGTVYPLDAPEHIVSVHVLGNGLVLLYCGDPEQMSFNALDAPVTSIYAVQIEDIRPDGFMAGTADFEPDTLSIHDYDWPE
ncbi:MAG: hypothetical protein HDT26_05660 [Subdoligranulum sp.]|nr:hypothetical protein [Subdoligranulum sp.]